MLSTQTTAYCYVRVSRPGQLPPAEPHIIDVAILDLNCGYPNLGHDSLVYTVASAAREARVALMRAGLVVRVLSFAVRDRHMVPDHSGGRYSIILGTGGPGHIDPALNDGTSPSSQCLHEDGAWLEPAHRLFEAILADEDAAMLAICHSFGVLCNWLGVAKPTLRGPEKGGKSVGFVENELTDEACRHPWFRNFAPKLTGGRRLTVSDSRLFDLIPNWVALPSGMTALAHEVLPDGTRGDALTMLELARDRGGVMPRILAVNHHPEINDANLLQGIIDGKVAKGEVSLAWKAERRRLITELQDPRYIPRQRLTARMTLIDPLRFHLFRVIRLRSERLAGASPFHEDEVLSEAASG